MLAGSYPLDEFGTPMPPISGPPEGGRHGLNSTAPGHGHAGTRLHPAVKVGDARPGPGLNRTWSRNIL